jgi:AsmA protein
MGKLFKFLFWLIGVVLVLAVAAVVVLPMVVDPNDYKDEIVAQVESNTGRTFRIDGELKLSVFPWLGLDIGGVELGNAQGFGEKPFAKVKQASVRVKLMPLLEGKAEADVIMLDGLALNLVRAKNGSSNWDDLGGKADEAPADAKGGSAPVGEISMGGVDISNAQILWDDRQLGQKLQVEQLNLKTGAINVGPAEGAIQVDVEGVEIGDSKFSWQDQRKKQRLNVAQLALKTGAVSAGPKAGPAQLSIGAINIQKGELLWEDRLQGQKVKIADLSLNSGSITPGKPVDLDGGLAFSSAKPQLQGRANLGGTVMLDDAAGKLKVDGLKLGLNLASSKPKYTGDFQLSGNLLVDQQAGWLKIGDLKASVDAKGDAIPQGALRADLQTAFAAALDGSALSLNNLKATSSDLSLSGNLKGNGLNTKTPVFSGNLKLGQFNLRKWMAALGMKVPQTADPKVLTRFAADVALSAKGKTTSFNKLAVTLDDTKLTGNASLTGSAASFALKVNAIDLDRYLPPKAEGQASGAPAGKGGGASGNEQVFPVKTLRGLNLNGTLNIGRLVVNRLLAEDVRVKVAAKNGHVKLDQQVNRFYGGNYKGLVTLNVAGKTPLLTADTNLQGVQAEPLLKQLADEDRLSGTAQFESRVKASGNSVNRLKKSLNGNLSFLFRDGSIKGINLAQSIRDAKALFEGKRSSSSDQPQQTDFSVLQGTGIITNGVLRNRDLSASSPYLRVKGAGLVDLVREYVDYTIRVNIIDTSKGQGGEELDELARKKIEVPVSWKGPLSSPKRSIHWQEIAFELAKERGVRELLNKGLGGASEEAGTEAASGAATSGSSKDQLKDSLRQGLKGLLK